MTGVLPIALGRATKIVQTLLKEGKEYVALMHLHKEKPEGDIRKIVKKFTGKIKQIPPVKSSVKRKLREREIYYLRILEIDGKDVLFKIGCEAGTYIRKLCLSGNTKIISNNKSFNMNDFIDKKFKDNGIESGTMPLSGNRFTYTWDSYYIKKQAVKALQRLPSPKVLMEIENQSGIILKLTEDHEILVDTEDGPKWREVKAIKVGDYVYSPREINDERSCPYLIELLDGGILIDDKKIKDKCKKAILKKFGGIKKGARLLRVYNRPLFSESKIGLRINNIKKICDGTNLEWNKLKKEIRIFKGECGLLIKPRSKKLNKDICYLLGLLMSDGNIRKSKGYTKPHGFSFTNKNKALLDKFQEIHSREFLNTRMRRKIMNKQTKVAEINSSNFVLANIAFSLGIKSQKKDSDLTGILNLSSELICSFIKGFFDGDGSCFIGTENKNSRESITIHTAYYNLAKTLYQLFKLIGVRSRIDKTNSSFGGLGYTISISTSGDKIKFIEIVGSNHPKKFEKLGLIKGRLGNRSPNDYDSVSLKCAKLLRDLRKKYKIPRDYCGEVYCRIEKGKVIPERLTIKKIISKLKDKIEIKDEKFRELIEICEGDFYIEKIKRIKKIRCNERYVYDLTIEGTHNFFPELALVVKNCHDIGQKLGTGGHLSGLIRTKAGLFTDKNWISLQDLKDAYEFYKEGSEEEIRKVILPMEKAITHLPKIWVFDTTVDALAHGADLYVVGVAKLNSDIKEGDLVAIFTLKDELICLGDAEMSSKEMLKKDKGLAIRTKKVFMEREIYSKFTEKKKL